MGNDFHHRTQWIINHGAGVLDIGITGADNLAWTFPDGSTSTASRPIKTVTAGVTVIRCDDFAKNGLRCIIYNTATALASTRIPAITLPNFRYSCECYGDFLSGDIARFPKVSYRLVLENILAMTGTIANAPMTTFNFYIINANLSGNLSSISNTITNISLASLPNVTGTASSIPSVTTTKKLYRCLQITGALSVVSSNDTIYFYGNSAVSPAEYDQTIANCVSAGGTGKTLFISSRRTSASDADKATLISRGWTVNDSNV
jgi:hypothetical protein